MSSIAHLNNFQRRCEPDCPLRTAFTTNSVQRSPPAHQHDGQTATEAEVRRISSKLYTPIKPWQTRIIRLQPGQPEDPISCKLEVAELVCFEGIGLQDEQDLVGFEALSYSWGRPAFSSSISCNGIRFPVTPNLTDALLHFRLPKKERFLWVDAICINQVDLVEKAR